MLKYTKKTGEHTYDVGLGTSAESIDFYTSLGMELTDVEQGVDGNWYDVGYAPTEPPEPTKEEKLADLDNQFRIDRATIMEYYTQAVFDGDTETQEELKAEMEEIKATYAEERKKIEEAD